MAGLREEIVNNTDQVLELMKLGESKIVSELLSLISSTSESYGSGGNILACRSKSTFW